MRRGKGRGWEGERTQVPGSLGPREDGVGRAEGLDLEKQGAGDRGPGTVGERGCGL